MTSSRQIPGIPGTLPGVICAIISAWDSLTPRDHVLTVPRPAALESRRGEKIVAEARGTGKKPEPPPAWPISLPRPCIATDATCIGSKMKTYTKTVVSGRTGESRSGRSRAGHRGRLRITAGEAQLRLLSVNPRRP
jgi:hypothetical protein